MMNIVTIYYSGYGHTKKQAEAVQEGTASVPGVNAELILIDSEGNLEEGDWQLLDEADAIIFGSPTYMGMVSWQFKKFADATSERWFTQKWKDKIAAGFTNSASMNGDKLSTLHYMSTLALQHAMIWVGNSIMPPGGKKAQRNDLNYFGSFAASGTACSSPVRPPNREDGGSASRWRGASSSAPTKAESSSSGPGRRDPRSRSDFRRNAPADTRHRDRRTSLVLRTDAVRARDRRPEPRAAGGGGPCPRSAARPGRRGLR